MNDKKQDVQPMQEPENITIQEGKPDVLDVLELMELKKQARELYVEIETRVDEFLVKHGDGRFDYDLQAVLDGQVAAVEELDEAMRAMHNAENTAVEAEKKFDSSNNEGEKPGLLKELSEASVIWSACQDRFDAAKNAIPSQTYDDAVMENGRYLKFQITDNTKKLADGGMITAISYVKSIDYEVRSLKTCPSSLKVAKPKKAKKSGEKKAKDFPF